VKIELYNFFQFMEKLFILFFLFKVHTMKKII